MIRKLILFLFFCFAVGRALPAFPGDFAYVLRFDPGKQSCIDQFDTASDEVTKTIMIDDDNGFNNMIVDETGGCYIAAYRATDDFCRDIYYYNINNDRISHFMHLDKYYGPSTMALTKDELIVQVLGEVGLKKSTSRVLFINRETRRITAVVSLEPADPDSSQCDSYNMYYDGEDHLFLTSFYAPGPVKNNDWNTWRQAEYTGDVFVIDVKNRRMEKRILIPREYKDIEEICCVGDKIYVAATSKGTLEVTGYIPSNTDLLIFSLKEGKLIKTREVSPFPVSVVYDRSVNKIYVLHNDDGKPRNTIEVIDPVDDHIISKLFVPSQLMASVVAPGKIYLTAGPHFIDKGRTSPKLVVINTKTDKIIKTIDGSYQGISTNYKY